ncbi:unnamed protein product, partial [Mesorhabditis belari]|uniref:G-protein coupled receptors family 1 profile domain-containing protein n=1 Tax=Mesorhabditis belari TaxID=2138241 RepID=A0AAF3EST4_9BILA
MLPIYRFVAGGFTVVILYELYAIGMVLYAIWRGRFCSRKSPIYIISTSNLVSDFLMLVIHLFYFVPSLFFQSYFFPKGVDDQRVIFLSSLFMLLWYQSSLSQILMAVNRVTVMCFSRYTVFTRKVTLISTLGIYPMSFVLAVFSQYIFPCCRFSFDYVVYSYRYVTIPNILNYPNTYFDLPLNSASTIVCALCYSWIVRWIYVFNSKTASEVSQKKKNMEIKYAKQFFLISVFYMNAWTSFRYLPILIGGENLFLYSFCSLNVLLNYGANGLVYYYTNSEVQAILRNGRNFSEAASSTYKPNIYITETSKSQAKTENNSVNNNN